LIDPYWERSEAAMRTTPELQERLRSREYWIRQSAAEVLGKLGQAQPHSTALSTESDPSRKKRHVVAEILTQMLSDVDQDFRQAAAEAFGRTNLGDGAGALATCLADPVRDVQLAAAKSLETLRWQPANATEQARYFVALEKWQDAAALGASAIDALAGVMNWGETAARRRAIEALVQIGGPQAESALITIAAETDEGVRSDAKSALMLMGHVEVAAPAGRRAVRLCA
jgi:HEAT repeat protein